MLNALMGPQDENRGEGCGVSELDTASPQELAFSPLPAVTGELIQDPDFHLPTTAGALPWRLFYYSRQNYKDEGWGFGRRASWPVRLCADTHGGITTVTLERENGSSVRYTGTIPGPNMAFTCTALTQRTFDTLVQNADGTWDETRFDTGVRFHYPAGDFASLSYYSTPQQQRVSFNYDAKGRLATIQDPANRLITYSYDSNNRVNNLTDWASRPHAFSYDSDGNMTRWQGPANDVTSYGYDSSHRLISITDPNNYSTTFTYDGRNRVLTRSVDGALGKYTYPDSNTTVYQDPLGHVWTTSYDNNGNVTQVVDPIGATRAATYDANGMPLTIQDALGYTTTMAYNTKGRMLSRMDARGASEVWTYDPYGNMLTYQDGLNRVTTYAYEGDGATRLRRSEQNALGKTTQFTHNSWGALATMQTPLGFVHTFSWNNYGTLDAETDAMGNPRSYQYDAAGNRTVVVDEMSRRITYTYDNEDRVRTSLNGVGALRQTIYDGVGNVQVVVDPLNNRTTYTYNARRQQTQMQDAKGNLWTTVYDAKGREIKRIDPLNHWVQSGYDQADRRISMVDGMGRTTTFQYDPVRQTRFVTDPAAFTTETVYDPVGHAIAQVPPTGLRTTFTFDAANQFTLTTLPDNTTHGTGYDLAGRVQVLVEPTGARTTTIYDDDGRARGTLDALNRSTQSSYDNVGRRTLFVDAGARAYTTTYDASGAVITQLNASGTWLQRFYDGAGRATVTLDHLGLRTTVTYDPADRVIEVQDVLANRTTTVYDALGQAIGRVDVLSQRYTTTYDSARRAVEVLDPLGNRTTTQYDASNAPTTHIDALGNQSIVQYDPAGRLLADIDPLLYRVTTLYDNYGRVSGHTDQNGNTTALLYDNFGRQAATQNARGYITSTIYDNFGRAIGHIDALGNRTTLSLDLANRTIEVQDALGYRTTTVYNVWDQATQQIDALNNFTYYGYDTRGNQVTLTDARGKQTIFVYDQFSRHTAMQDALTYWTYTGYDDKGRVNSTTDARGYITTTIYDNYGRFSATQDPKGNLSTNTYDNVGRMSAHIDPAGFRTTQTYDALWRVRDHQNARGYFVTTIYDARGMEQASLDAIGRRTTYVYDGVGHGIRNILPDGTTLTFVYDEVGNQIASINGKGNATTQIYDARNLRTATIDPLGRRTTYNYDAVGQVVTMLNARGQMTTYVYNGRGEEIQRFYAEGTTVTFGFDEVGNMKGVTDPVGRHTYTYDAADQLQTQNSPGHPGGQPLTHGYDGSGNRTQMQTPQGNFAYTFDNRNQRSQLTDPGSASVGIAAGSTANLYDARGLTISQTNPDGTLTTYTYNEVGQVLQIRHTQSGGAEIDHAYYTYDPVDRPLTKQTVPPVDMAIATGSTATATATAATYDPNDVRGGDRTGQLFDSGQGWKSSGTLPQSLEIDFAASQSISEIDVFTLQDFYGYGFDPTSDQTFSLYGVTAFDVQTWNGTGWVTVPGGSVTGNNLVWRSFTFPAISTSKVRVVVHASVDGVARLVSVEAYNSSTSQTTTYTHDALDQLIGTTDPTLGTFTYTYDKAFNKLTEASRQGVTTYSYDAADQLTTVQDKTGLTTYTYDASGNVSVTRAPEGTTTYTWDSRDRLIQTQTPPSRSGQAGKTLGYTYRYDDLMVRKTGPSGVETLTYDGFGGGGDVLFRQRAQDGLNQTFVTGDEVIRSVGTGGGGSYQARQYHLDGQSNVQTFTGAPGQAKQISLYFLDWDNSSHTELLYVRDAVSKAVLDTQTISGFQNGVWLTWNIQGAVEFYFNRMAGTGPTCVVSGVFFDAAPASYAPTRTNDAVFVGTDTTTQGNWIGHYGSLGYSIADYQANLPSDITMSFLAEPAALWAASTTDVRALRKAAPATDRIASRWYHNVGFTFTVRTFARPLVKRQQVSLYLVDWDGVPSPGVHRTQTITLFDAVTGNTLDTQTVDNFYNGVWLTWNIQGTVGFVFTKTAGANCVLSGMFLDVAPASYAPTRSNDAVFVGTDTTTQGSWINKYGSLGYYIVTYAALFPPDALLYVGGQATMGWTSSTTDVRALQKLPPATDRILGCVYSAGDFRVTLEEYQSVGSSADMVLSPFGNTALGNASDNPFAFGGGIGYWNEPDVDGLTYVRARWLDTNTGRWLSTDPVEGEHPYSYADNAPTMFVDPTGTQKKLTEAHNGHLSNLFRPLPAKARSSQLSASQIFAPLHPQHPNDVFDLIKSGNFTARLPEGPLGNSLGPLVHVRIVPEDEIDWTQPAWAVLQHAAVGLGTIALAGLLVGSGAVALPFIVVGAVLITTAAVVAAGAKRYYEYQDAGKHVDWSRLTVVAVGDVTGFSAIYQGATNKSALTRERLNLTRTARATEIAGGATDVATFLLAPKAYEFGYRGTQTGRVAWVMDVDHPAWGVTNRRWPFGSAKDLQQPARYEAQLNMLRDTGVAKRAALQYIGYLRALGSDVPAAVSAIADRITGDISIAFSNRAWPSVVHPLLKARVGVVALRASRITGNPTAVSLEPWEVGMCAEFHALNDALFKLEASSGRPATLLDLQRFEMHTSAVRRVTGPKGTKSVVVNDFYRCLNCEITSSGVKITSDTSTAFLTKSRKPK